MRTLPDPARSSCRYASCSGCAAGACRADAVSSLPGSATSSTGAPTSMVSPGVPCSAVTTPANGEGSSTTLFAVSTSAMA